MHVRGLPGRSSVTISLPSTIVFLFDGGPANIAMSLEGVAVASPAHVAWARRRPDANPTEVCPKELVGTRIVLMVVQETGDPRLH